MKRLALAAGVALLTVLGLVATPAVSEDTPVQVTPQDPCTEHPHPATEQRQLAKRIFAPKRWRRSAPARGHYAEVELLRSCATPEAIEPMRRRWETERRSFHRYRLYRQVAPYRAPGGLLDLYGERPGPRHPGDRRWWAIPINVVCGESGFDFYVNGDGGYQIIPSTWQSAAPRSFPDTAGAATPLQQHIVAAKLWGTTPWYGAC